MSEVSVLSNQYKKLVDTSEKVNNSVIVYKKKKLLGEPGNKQKYPKLSVSTEDTETAKNVLVPFLINLKQILDEDLKDSEFIPSIVLDDYKKKLGDNQFIREDLQSLIEGIDHGKNTSVDDISMLDTILSVLDNERNTLFRKLRTARG